MFGKRNKLFYLKALIKIKSLLNTQKYRRFLVFFFFFLISLGFWLLQTLKNDFEVELFIPVKLINVPNDVVLTAKPTAQLKVVVKDKGTVILNYMMGQDFYPIVLNFKDYHNRGNHVVIHATELEKKVQAQLEPSTKLVAIKPEVVDYFYSLGAVKKVPVVFRGKVNVGLQYYVTDTLFSPDSVCVYAPQNMLQSVDKAATHLVLLDSIMDTKQVQVKLLSIRGVKFVPNAVTVTFPVDIYTEKTLVVSLVGNGFPPNRALRTFPSKVKVTFQVGLRRFKSIHPQDFVFDIPYDSLLKSKSEKYRLVLKSMPKGIKNVRVSPQQVDFLIEQVAKHGN